VGPDQIVPAAKWLAERVAGVTGAPDAAELQRLHRVLADEAI
jgi:hypothetical protein